MPRLTLKFDNRELQACALDAHPISIGRLPDNTIVVDNPAVSGRHARVFREGDHYVVEDLKSTNGTFINDKPVARHTLVDGDVILIGKHALTFSVADGDEATAVPRAGRVYVQDIGGTMVLDTMRQKSLLENLDRGRSSQMHTVIPKTSIPAPPPRAGSVRVVSGKTDQPEYPLTAVTTVVGKGDNAHIKLKGWFKPKVAAAIARKADGFTASAMGADVSVNGKKISGRVDLHDGDIIEVSGLTLEFKLV